MRCALLSLSLRLVLLVAPDGQADSPLVLSLQSASLQTDRIGIRDAAKMPPLLQRLSERQPENLDYLGTSYGVTPLLFKFWKRAGYVPLYMRQTTNDLTGEHSCIMIRGLNKNEDEAKRWLGDFSIGASSLPLLGRARSDPD